MQFYIKPSYEVVFIARQHTDAR